MNSGYHIQLHNPPQKPGKSNLKKKTNHAQLLQIVIKLDESSGYGAYVKKGVSIMIGGL